MKSSSTDRSLNVMPTRLKWKEEDIPMKGTTNPLYAAVHERRGSMRPQPSNTILYEVKGTDTLASVAAHFNTTPAELVNLNRLICRTICPGQIIYVPDTGSTALEPEKPSEPVNGQHSPKPGHVERVDLCVNKNIFLGIDNVRSPSEIAEDLNKESFYRFLKINAKHITDGQGVVSGVLLVTPNHLMFDPNVSDALVIEHGVEKYGVVAPMHMVVRAALYPDIVRMRIKDASLSSLHGKKPELYRSKNFTLKKSRSHDETLNIVFKGSSEKDEEITSVSEIFHPPLLTKISECSFEYNSGHQEDRAASSKSADVHEEPSSLVQLPSNQKPENESLPAVGTTDAESLSHNDPSLVTSQSFDRQSSCEDENTTETIVEESSKKKSGFEKTKQKLQKGLRKLSITDGIFPTNSNQRRMSLPTTTSFPELNLKSPTVPSSGKKCKPKEQKLKQESPAPAYMNMVEDKPELFISLEKLIPRPAKSFDDNPLYLCLRMGRPLKESVHTRFSPVMNFGRKMKAEYWFSIPREKVDSLYFFFLRWAPDRYGDIDDINLEELGFAPIDEDEEDLIAEPPAAFVPSQRRATWAFPWKRRKSSDEAIELERETSWELVAGEECTKEPSLTESELNFPELTSPSSILTEEHIKKLCEHLPPRAVGYAWELIYSTAVNGFSLKTLYREMANYDSPVLIVIANTSGAIFGAMLSSPLKMSDHFYGTGESFLFTFYPEFKYFPWAGENNYFIKGNTGSFAIGASDGQFGLWLDDDLYHGCSKACLTFNNDCLSDEVDFVVKALEAWGFV